MNPQVATGTTGNPVLSVIIRAHNPHADYLSHVIEALRDQTLAKWCWELFLIDNASSGRLEDIWDLSWHPNARHVREDELGQTPALLRGIRESRGELLIIVDDDNVLAPDYLEQALRVEREWPILGAWGGDVTGEFETQPDPWTRAYWGYLCIRECKEARWSNNPEDWDAIPYGGGLCIRAEVASVYAQQHEATPYRKMLGRKGTALLGGEDIDMVLFCRRRGLGFGRFPELHMTHLIPTRRLTESYLVELVRAINHSSVLVGRIHGYDSWRTDRVRDSALWSLVHLALYGRRSLRFHRARLDGLRAGLRVVEQIPANPQHSVAND
jgi:glycosyltransferase involved in cell wall biosynthesis